VAVRWHAGNPQHLKLKATIDYSTDGGASWRTIFIGPSTGRAILPSYYFTDSRKAQVRVRVNDGFNETVATSGTFTALGSRPTVSILTPTGGTTFAADATIPLAGQAFDDALAPLTGNRLTWTYAGAVIGHGASTSVAGLPVGTDLITLTARDGHRRAAHASVTVNVTPVSIRFLDVHVPTSVATTATQLQLTARSTVAATLTIGARQVPIGPRRRSVAISIREGNAPVLVRLSVSALGATYPLAYLVGRSPNLPPNPPHPPPCGLECV
jgi:hypothetical protein